MTILVFCGGQQMRMEIEVEYLSVIEPRRTRCWPRSSIPLLCCTNNECLIGVHIPTHTLDRGARRNREQEAGVEVVQVK